MIDAKCYSCRSISGEQRISPGLTIHESRYWVIEHAYPCAVEGWLVIVLRRHAAAAHELTAEEFAELFGLLEKTIHAVRQRFACEKEYIACFAEAPHFNHVHFHVIPKPANLSQELAGTNIFALLNANEYEPVDPERVSIICRQLQEYFRTAQTGV